MPSTPLIKARFLVVDLEMTGLDPSTHEIIEVAAVPVTGTEIGSGFSFYSEIRPERNIPAETKAVHGLHGRELSNAPSLQEVLPELFKNFYNRIIVGHNAHIDLDFLMVKARVAGLMPPKRPIVDTIDMALTLFPEQEKPSLDKLLAQYKLARKHNIHNAIEDALLTARVFVMMLNELRSSGKASTVVDLLRIGKE